MTTLKAAWRQDIRGKDGARSRSIARRARLWIAVLFGLAILGGGAALWQSSKADRALKTDVLPASALTVTVAVVEKGRLPRSLMITGSLAARDELPIGTETSGLAISEVAVDVGDHVRQGQILARFDDAVLRAQVRQAQASLSEAEANAAEALANARRADELARNGWISGKDFDNRRATAQSMQARVGVAEANLALAQAHLKQADLRAPSDGTITLRNAHLGAVVSAGAVELFRMIRDDRVELVAELPESDLAQIRAGQNVTLAVDGAAAPAVGLAGVVRLVEPTVDVKTRIGRVRIDVDKGAGALPGMFVTGQVMLGQVESLVAPETAVIYQDGKPKLFVVADDNRVERRPVTLGPRDHGRIAVLSGVAAGERVALRGAAYLKSGDRVTVVEAPADSGAASVLHSN